MFPVVGKIYNRISNMRLILFFAAIPETGFIANPNTMLVMTSHGGHFGFLEGMGPTINGTWMNRICRQLLTALKNYD